MFRFLHAADPHLDSPLCGLEAHEGAEDLLRGQGEIGSALFSASSGGASIRRVLDSLNEESGKLFKGRAIANVSIRPAAKRHKELLRESREAMVRPETWETLEREMSEWESVRKQVEAAVTALDGQLDWASRSADALPSVGRLTEELMRLGELPNLTELAGDFLARARSAREKVRETGQAVRTALSQVRLLEDQLGRCVPAPELLEEGDALEGLHQQLGGYRIRKESLTSLRTQLAEIELETLGLTRDVEVATADWETRCRAIGLPEGTSPEAGLALLDERTRLLARFDDWEELSGEARNLEEAVGRYEREVTLKAAALKIDRDTTEAREAGLWEALTRARKVQAEHDQLIGQLNKAKATLAAAEEERQQADRELEELMGLAKVSRAEELEPLLAGLEQRAALRGRIQTLREHLGGLARGLSVDEFVVRVQAENPDELPQRQARLKGAREEKKSELQEALEALARLKHQKKQLEAAGDAAADLQQQAESVAAQLRTDAARFIRLRLAVHFLRTQIEQFRQKTQGPLLEKSGRLFSEITRRTFTGLSPEMTAQDEQVMVGVRPDGRRVPVTGMSDGSRDQLYLSLRLAALEHYLESHEPMPLILDDLLITFDDARAGAILPQLAELSKRTQVLLFTHHQHLVELCRRGLGESRFHLHRLERSP